MVHLHSRQLLIQPCEHNAVRPLKPSENLSCGIEKLCLSRQQVSLFQPMNHAFTKFQLDGFSPLLQPSRLV